MSLFERLFSFFVKCFYSLSLLFVDVSLQKTQKVLKSNNKETVPLEPGPSTVVDKGPQIFENSRE